MTLYEILKDKFGSNAAIGRRFPKNGKARTPAAVGRWKINGVPEEVALKCHLSEDIPYKYDPTEYQQCSSAN